MSFPLDPRVELRDMIEPLNAFARRFYSDPVDAEDLVQETLLRALASLDSYTQGTRMKSWLFTIMRNAFYNRVRVYDREKPAAADCASSQGRTAATQDVSVDCHRVLDAIQALPLDQKEVVVLVSILGITYHDASEICGCRIGTVQSRLHRARTKLGRKAVTRDAPGTAPARPSPGGAAGD